MYRSRTTIHFEDFDPNKMEGSDTIWGVYAGDAFKVYDRRGSALSRFAHWPRAKLYEFVPGLGKWIERGVKDSGAHGPDCDLCQGTTIRQLQYDSKPVDHGDYCWDRVGSKIKDPLVLYYACIDCRNARGWR